MPPVLFNTTMGDAPPGDGHYQIPKTLPWRRMVKDDTKDEGAAVMAVMDTVDPRLRGLYDAALYLSTNDELWPVLRDLLASAVGGYKRADELLAPET